MKKLLLTTVTAIALAIVGGCSDQSEQQAAQAGAGQQPAPTGSVVTVQNQPVEHLVTLPGRVSPMQQSQVRPQVEGVLTERLFEEGAQVEKGQQLYQIDEARYLAQLNSAKADFKVASACSISPCSFCIIPSCMSISASNAPSPCMVAIDLAL